MTADASRTHRSPEWSEWVFPLKRSGEIHGGKDGRPPARDFCFGCSQTSTSGHTRVSCTVDTPGGSWEQLSEPLSAGCCL